ncbi:hypothetical protein WMF04_34145 [Sorangium sp. So ce260]|uniref:hypothetical protein n=1 Tax=Sorangium sp. So ce260 TaxID=3133291 RepID=UPI003F6106F9
MHGGRRLRRPDMSDDPAAFDAGAPWVQHLERAHALIHAVARFIEGQREPSAYLAPAARKLELGLGALYDAFDGRADRVTAVGRAHGHVWAAAVLFARAGLPRVLASLRDACAELIAAEGRFARVPHARSNAALLRAGVDRPPLHFVDRASLVPSFRAPQVSEPEPEARESALVEPKNFDDLAAVAEKMRRLARERTKALLRPARPAPARAKPGSVGQEAPPGFAFAPPAAMSESDFVRRWSRACFEEIGMLGIQRAPLPGDDWRSCQTLELRLVAAIDALASLGPTAIAQVEALAMDAPAVDPMRVFAAAMIGGCLEGRDSLACAERVLFRFGPGDRGVAEAFVSAMKLAQNPFLPSCLRALSASAERGCRAIAVEVLAYRGWLTPAELEELGAEEDTRVFALGLPALAAARHPRCERAIERALAHESLDVQAAGLDAMMIAAHRRTAEAARRAAQAALEDRALVRLALVAGEQDAWWLLERMQRSPTPAAVEAVGWAGLVESIPPLLDLLESAAEAVAFAAGSALERLLGANLVEEVEVDPEAFQDVVVIDPNPEPFRGRRPLGELVSDPRDRPPVGSRETLDVPSTDSAHWRAYWSEHKGRFDPRQRLRRGQKYSPSVSLHELSRLSLPVEDRRRLCTELAAQTGRWAHFDPHDFVADQERCLGAWRAIVQATREAPGTWGQQHRGD